MKNLGGVVLAALFLSGCSDTAGALPYTGAGTRMQTGALNIVNQTVLQEMEWQESTVFSYEGKQLQGIPGKIGWASSPLQEGEQAQSTWFFLAPDVPAGEVSVIAVKQGTNEVSPMLILNGKPSWNGAVINGPCSFSAGASLPASGSWAVQVYIGAELYAQLAVTVH